MSTPSHSQEFWFLTGMAGYSGGGWAETDNQVESFSSCPGVRQSPSVKSKGNSPERVAAVMADWLNIYGIIK